MVASIAYSTAYLFGAVAYAVTAGFVAILLLVVAGVRAVQIVATRRAEFDASQSGVQLSKLHGALQPEIHQAGDAVAASIQ